MRNYLNTTFVAQWFHRDGSIRLPSVSPDLSSLNTGIIHMGIECPRLKNSVKNRVIRIYIADADWYKIPGIYKTVSSQPNDASKHVLSLVETILSIYC